MTDDNKSYDGDELLVKQFLSQGKTDIADEGFSRRVMRSLPTRAWKLSRLWTCCCIAVFVLLFIVFHGWDFVELGISNTVYALSSKPILDTLSWRSVGYMAVGAILLTLVGIHKLTEIMEDK